MTTLPPLPDHRMEALRALDSLGAVDEASGVTVAAIADRAGMDAGRAWLAVSQLYHQGFVRPGSLFDHDDHRKYTLTDSGRAVLEIAPAQSGEGRSGAGEDAEPLCDKPEWIKHSGGGNPVAPHHLVEIKQRGGDTGIYAAGSLTWKHGAFIWEVLDTVPETDIVAWRLVNPYKLNKALAALNARQSGEGERGQ